MQCFLRNNVEKIQVGKFFFFLKEKKMVSDFCALLRVISLPCAEKKLTSWHFACLILFCMPSLLFSFPINLVFKSIPDQCLLICFPCFNPLCKNNDCSRRHL